MNITVFDYDDYKKYLEEWLATHSQVTRGLRSAMTKHICCQSSYLSQVLNGKPHLTLEQAIRSNQFCSHRKDEARFFILLWEYAKSGSKESRDFFFEQISEMRQQRFHLKKRLTSTGEVDLAHQHKYYSTWFYSAIHLALMIPKFQDPRAIAEHFNLPLDLVQNVISFLEEAGLIALVEGRYEHTQRRVHLNRESDFIQRHHINWRSQSLQAVEKNFPENLHYSNVTAISKQDFLKIKEIFIQAIESARTLIGPSKEEALYAITLDFFEL